MEQNEVLANLREQLNKALWVLHCNINELKPFDEQLRSRFDLLGCGEDPIPCVIVYLPQILPGMVEQNEEYLQRLRADTINELGSETVVIFSASFISPQTGEALVKKRFNFVDLSGNVFLRFKEFAVYFKNPKNEHVSYKVLKQYSRNTARRVVEALLRYPEGATITTREIEKISGVSKSMVYLICRNLVNKGAVKIEDKRFKIGDTKILEKLLSDKTEI